MSLKGISSISEEQRKLLISRGQGREKEEEKKKVGKGLPKARNLHLTCPELDLLIWSFEKAKTGKQLDKQITQKDIQNYEKLKKEMLGQQQQHKLFSD